MSEDGKEMLSREERLAEKLRENLRRRKSQARAHEKTGEADSESGVPKTDMRG